MNTKKVIIISAATCLAVHALIWMLGWLVWPLVFISLWAALGKLAIYSEMLDEYPERRLCNSFCYLTGPIGLVVSLIDNIQRGKIKLSKYIPKFQNPFVWTKDDN